jgi:uncharacterized membrane protein YkvA (DUF1232 family)
LAARDPRTPIDLIPDFVPILGYLDDLILVPLGIALAIRLIRGRVLDECWTKAQESLRDGSPKSRTAAAVIVALWLALAALSIVWAYKAFAG